MMKLKSKEKPRRLKLVFLLPNTEKSARSPPWTSTLVGITNRSESAIYRHEEQ